MSKIQGVYAREILDSRGIPTIECTMWLDSGAIVATGVPSGTSVGKYEAVELRDNQPNRMDGKGVLQAVDNINNVIAPQVIGKDPANQFEIDQLLVNLDGTANKSRLGANAILAVSQAVLKAGALSSGLPLYYFVQQKYQLVDNLYMPTSIFSLINGGDHGADNLDIQEFQVIPASHMNFLDGLNMGVNIFHTLEKVLVSKGAVHSTGIVGGFTPNLYSNSDVFEIMVETIKATTYTFAQDLFFGIDVAASEIYSGGKYKLKDRADAYSTSELIEYYKKIRDLYHVFYIEDPFYEDDLEGWKTLTKDLGETTKIVGDSLLVTNPKKTQDAIAQKLCNTLIVKPNQSGTISETIEVIKIAKAEGWQVIMSHRSGETNDDLVADLSVGVGADYTKFGPPNRGERVSKYNRLLQINTEINQNIEAGQ
jgi:enolase